MDFRPTDSQQNIKQMVHWLAENKVRPVSLAADQSHGFDPSFLLELKQMGVSQGATEGEDRPGGDPKRVKQTSRAAVIGAEEMAWGDAALILSLPGPGLGGPPVRMTGTPEQQKRFFAPF